LLVCLIEVFGQEIDLSKDFSQNFKIEMAVKFLLCFRNRIICIVEPRYDKLNFFEIFLIVIFI